ncbi:MAG: MAPEG family protein [Sphingomonas sp.]
MTTELYWLTLTLLMTALFAFPYVLNRIGVRGLMGAMSGTRPENGGDHALWAQRAMGAHRNAVENLVLFAPAVLIAHALNLSTGATKTAAMVYFIARLVHYVVYVLAVPVARTLAFAAGLGATFVFLVAILGAA